MERRSYLKALPATPMLPAVLSTEKVMADRTITAVKEVAPKSAVGDYKAGKLPAYTGKIGYSDMTNTDADGKPQSGFAHRKSKPKKADPISILEDGTVEVG